MESRMQREIKFRGKSKYDGKWVYGYYVEHDGYDYGIIFEPNGLGHDVDRKTVGSWIGLIDKNGKEIYEGDILEWRIRNDPEGILYRYEVYYESNDMSYYIGIPNTDVGYWVDVIRNGWAVVIGNKFENPELLKDPN